VKLLYFHKLLSQSNLCSFNYLFVAGQQEVHTVVRKLRKSFPLKKNNPQIKVVKDSEKNEAPEALDKEHSEKDDSEDNSDDDFDAEEALRRNKQRQKKQIILPTINLDEYVHSNYNTIILLFHNVSQIYHKNIYV